MSLGTPWFLLLLPLVALVGWQMARARRLQREAACRLKGVAPDRGRTDLSGIRLIGRPHVPGPDPVGLHREKGGAQNQ